MSSPDETPRRQAEAYGRFAEQLSCLSLLLRGYSILERRLRTPLGEIDIVARRGDTLIVVEVKARDEWGKANEAVNARTRGRLARAAKVWLSANPQYAGYVLRFDVMLVTPWAWPRHLPDAWRG